MISNILPLLTPLRLWLRRHRSFFLWLALTGFIAGFFVFRYGELQLGWFALLGILPLAVSYRTRVGHLLTSQPLPAVVVGGSLLMLLTSILTLEDPLPGWGKVGAAVSNIVLLAAFFVIPPLAIARRKMRLAMLLKTIVVVAAGATILSFIIQYGVRGGAVPGERFRNVFVYNEGLNPVLTGLSCGFAAMLALGLGRRAPSRPGFWAWWALALLLMAGVFYSGSRSAIIATVAGTAVMIATAPRDRRWKLGMPLLAMAVIYGAGFLGGNGPLAPMKKLMERGDSGRMAIYSAVSKRMVEPQHIFMGHGLWAEEALPPEEAGDLAFHAHSMYASTFYHNGLLGVVWLFAVLGLGLERAWAVWWRSGDAVWLALLAFGMCGLLCDGTMPFRLMTITRIEPLLILFPLAFASAVAAGLERHTRREDSRQTSRMHLPTLVDPPVPMPVRIRLERGWREVRESK
jgi:hypothetical protein